MLHQFQLIPIERREAEEDVGFERFTFLPVYIFDGLKYVVKYGCKVMFNKAITETKFLLFIYIQSLILCGQYAYFVNIFIVLGKILPLSVSKHGLMIENI